MSHYQEELLKSLEIRLYRARERGGETRQLEELISSVRADVPSVQTETVVKPSYQKRTKVDVPGFQLTLGNISQRNRAPDQVASVSEECPGEGGLDAWSRFWAIKTGKHSLRNLSNRSQSREEMSRISIGYQRNGREREKNRLVCDAAVRVLFLRQARDLAEIASWDTDSE